MLNKQNRSGPVSRVLSRAIISLGRRLPAASSNLPGSGNGSDRSVPAICRLLPVWSCSQWGLPCQCGHPHRGALLPHLFTLTAASCETEAVCFLWHCPGPYGRWALPTTASCGARTFLRMKLQAAPSSDHSVHSGELIVREVGERGPQWMHTLMSGRCGK